MPPTPRLYFDDPFLIRFQSRVVGHGAYHGRPSLLLAETAFYPEAGGQMADRGTLAGRALVDAQVDDEGAVHHLLDGALPEIGAEVEGALDWPRRRAHMALHTGQHMLSRALLDVAAAETLSSRLGETACTVDVSLPELADRDLARAEALVCAAIDDDRPVRAWFPSAEELASLRLRREPKVDNNVRVIEVAGFDASPCGGTHCTRTGQVGLVRVLGSERYKGGRRITFEAGPRARALLSAESEALRALAQGFACPPLEVPAAVERLRAELRAGKDAGKAMRGLLAERLAEALSSSASSSASLGGQVVATLPGGDAELLRAVGKLLTQRPGRVAFLAAASGEALDVLVVRSDGQGFDCGAFVKRVVAAAGGRGGGRPGQAEGRLPVGADWPALVAAWSVPAAG